MLSIARTCTPVTSPTCYLPPSPPPSSLLIKQDALPLPPNPSSIFHQLSNHVLQQRKALRPHNSQLEIHHVTPTNFQAFLDQDREAPILKRIKLEYDASSSRIIMCPPPLPYHDCTPYFLQSALFALRSTPFDTPARQRSLVVREVAFQSSDGSYLVPDAAVVVTPLGAPARIWPTIVVEVANTQLYANARAKVKRWFTKSRGLVEVVLLLKFTAEDPILDPSCFLEVWRYGVPPEDTDGMIVEGEVDGSDCDEEAGDLDDEAGLDSNDFSDAGSCSGSGIDQSSITVDQQGDPFPESETSDPDGSDCSSLHSIGNASDFDTTTHNAPGGQTDADALLVDVGTVLSDSDSSLSSLEGDEASPIPPTTGSDAPSSSSDASTSAYRPTPRRHKLHMYRSGARQTVLPVADPVDPEMQHLALRYSDFFGSENVPENRDRNEQVLLNLDELRLEIALLMGLTEGIVGNVKKRAGEGSQSWGKKPRR